MRLRKDLDEISEIINSIVGVVCVALTALMFISVFIQVIGRYITEEGTAWTEETARYTMIWLAFLGASTLVRNWDNTSVTFFKDKLPEKVRTIADIAIMIIMFVFMAFVCILSICEVPKYTLREFSPALKITMFIPKSSVLFGSLIVCVQLLWKIIDSILALADEGGGGL